MLQIFKSLFRKENVNSSLMVKDVPLIPSGADSILYNQQAFKSGHKITAGELSLVSLDPGQAYSSFVQTHEQHHYCDAAILDGLIQLLIRDDVSPDMILGEYLGESYGQFFFFGTEFATDQGNAVAFLNWKTAMPALRYLCPMKNPIRHDLPCYAVVANK